MSSNPFNTFNPFLYGSVLPYGQPFAQPLVPQIPQLPQAPRSNVKTNKTGQSLLDLGDQILQAASSFCAIKQASVGILAGGFGGGFGGGGINPFASPLAAYPQALAFNQPRFV